MSSGLVPQWVLILLLTAATDICESWQLSAAQYHIDAARMIVRLTWSTQGMSKIQVCAKTKGNPCVHYTVSACSLPFWTM